ncbi:asparagine--tRNA ligase [Desulfohalovibrio reitneri]|uniref:asparagine--tRNA ligase n=1 Tax=Desulfohalovibrio reitneri TaxID=1307759 RepID=UPI0004A7718C|nr:asparagine--tRNA ligase [Desulfohalovibrio reitneri]
MQWRRVREALESEGPIQEIEIRGWVRTKRDQKKFAFLEINDGSCLANLQVILDSGAPGWDELERVTTGAAVAVSGDLVESPGKGQRWEMRASGLRLVGVADAEDYPLQKKRHSDEFLRTIAHLRPRTNKYGAMFRIRAEAAFAVHSFFRERGFHNVHTPIITGADCEGAGELFRVTSLDPGQPHGSDWPERDFFGKESFLTVSGQLAAEAFALSLGRVYTFGPTFRAENSNTPRHAAEFWMVEPEMAFFNLDDTMNLAEEFIKELVRHVRDTCAQDIALFAKWVDKDLEKRLENILAEPFQRLPYAEAVEILKKSGKNFEYPVEWGEDLQTEHERYLTEKHFGKPVIVHDYPTGIKAFYMRLSQDGKTVGAMDLLVPRIGELVGGSQREERESVLEKRVLELDLDRECYRWYLDLRRFGSAPHSGFGMGFERFLMLVTGASNIRDVIAFPRTPKHLEF